MKGNNDQSIKTTILKHEFDYTFEIELRAWSYYGRLYSNKRFKTRSGCQRSLTKVLQGLNFVSK